MTFLELLVQRRIPYRPRSKPGEIWLCCPRPSCEDTRFRLGVNWRKNVGHCFNCGWKTRKAIQSLLRLWRIEAQIQGGEDLPEEKPEEVHLPEDFSLVTSLDSDPPWGQPLAYLRQRGFKPSQLRRHRIGASFVGRFAFRIVMPVYYKRELCGLVGRSWCGREPKYLNSTGKRVIWNMDRREGPQILILAEGIFKAMALEAAGPSAVYRASALLGHSITEVQLDQIEECGFRRVVVWPDPDPQGIKGARQICEQLQERGLEASIPWPLPTRQADEMDASELDLRLRKRESFGRMTRWRMTLEERKR